MKEKDLKKTRVANPVRNPKLLETIKLNDGYLHHIEYHTARFNFARKQLYGINSPLDLSEAIIIPENIKTGFFKCRLIYGERIERIEFKPYLAKAIKKLKVVVSDQIQYPFKFLDRSQIDELTGLKGDCDDILIIRNGLVTDTSYANVALWDGNCWLTPEIPLLPGTTRSRLLHKGDLRTAEIEMQELTSFSKLRIFNAMFDVELPVSEQSLEFSDPKSFQ